MRIVIDIPEEMYQEIKETDMVISGRRNGKRFDYILFNAVINGTPLPEHLNKIKDDIGRYELDCRFADYSQTDECTICNKNVFGSIYRIIDKYIEGSESE